MGTFVKVATLDELPEGRATVIEAGKKRLCVCKVNGAIYAIDDECTHDGGPLGEGWLEGTTIECPRHGARFDVTTGRVLSFPAVVPVRSYQVRIEGQDVLVEID